MLFYKSGIETFDKQKLTQITCSSRHGTLSSESNVAGEESSNETFLNNSSRLPLSVRQFRGGGRRAGIIVVERTTALESIPFLPKRTSIYIYSIRNMPTIGR